jgi:hypothetical protein
MGRAHKEGLIPRGVDRWPGRLAAYVHKTTQRKGREIGPFIMAVRSSLTKTGNRCEDEMRVQPFQILITKAQPRQKSRLKALRYYIYAFDEFAENGSPIGSPQIQRDAFLVAVEVEKVQAAVRARYIVFKRSLTATAASIWRFYLNNLRPKVGQQFSTVFPFTTGKF